MKNVITPEERDSRVLELYERVLEIEQRLIPTGLHIFGVAPGAAELRSLLTMVASFDRGDVRALTDLVAAGLGLRTYSVLLAESASNEQSLADRERVEDIAGRAVALFLSNGAEAAAGFLEREAGVKVDECERVFELLRRVKSQLESNDELQSLARALRGEYLLPGPGADIIQNPDVLPTGRNTYAINPYTVPSEAAVRRAEPLASALLDRHFKECGRYPESIAMVLWGTDNIKTQGEAVAQALHLLGVRPRRDGLNRATGVDVIPLEQLGRPRIDVVMTVSGIFRDLFGPTMALLDLAVRTVAALDEPDDLNFVSKHVREQIEQSGASFDDASARVFSNAAGNYGTNVNFMVLDSQWESAGELGSLFITRKCFAYGRGKDGREARELMEQALGLVEAGYQSIDSVEIGITDVDHYFEYLGGVSKAVEKQTGARPRIYLSDTTSPGARVRTLEETVGLETRTKTLNPKWYEGMLKHGFSGVAEIEHHITNTFGWSATANAVDKWVYDQIAGVYILDEQMLERLRALNPHSTRAIIGRLLEASGRGLWQADPSVIEKMRDLADSLEDELEGVMS
jgi:magnesium chelatase subunit H